MVVAVAFVVNHLTFCHSNIKFSPDCKFEGLTSWPLNTTVTKLCYKRKILLPGGRDKPERGYLSNRNLNN